MKTPKNMRSIGAIISLTLLASISFVLPASASVPTANTTAPVTDGDKPPSPLEKPKPSPPGGIPLPAGAGGAGTGAGKTVRPEAKPKVPQGSPQAGEDGSVPSNTCIIKPTGRECLRNVSQLHTGGGIGSIGAFCYGKDTVGIRIKFQFHYDPITMEPLGEAFNRQILCVNKVKTQRTLKCVSHLDGKIDQVAPGSRARRLVTSVVKTPYGKGSTQSYGNCIQTVGKNYNIKVNEILNDFGRYKASATVYYRMMKVDEKYNPLNGTFTHEVKGVSTLRSSTNTNYAEITCKGAVVGGRGVWKSSDFTMKPCEDGKGKYVNYTCKIPKTAKINGVKTNSASIFRDGKANRVDFGTPKLKGKNLVASSAKVTKTKLNRSGTPWKNNAATTSNTFQLSKKGAAKPLAIKSGGIGLNGSVSAYDARGFDASIGKSPTKLRNEYTFKGTWRVKTYMITGITDKGKPVMKTTTTKINSTAVCKSPTVKLNFVRGVTSE